MPFLRNTWYCAGWAHELGREPMLRKLLGEPVLFYRKQDGSAVAIGNRCPHRFAPLHKGKLIGDAIQCPYHGLQFDATGACVHNPQGGAPRAAHVPAYPLTERDGILWIWMGEAERADATLIPDFSPLVGSDRCTVVYGYLHIPAHYELMSDNLLDLSHVRYLHPFLSDPRPPLPGFKVRITAQQQGNTVVARNTLVNCRPNQLYRMLWQQDVESGDARAHMRWDPPSNLLLDTGITYPGRPEAEGPSTPTAHLLTPETENSTHYYFAVARDRLLGDAEVSKFVLDGVSNAFANEDEPMIRWCQENMGTTDLESLNPVLLSADAAPVLARRILKKLIAAEQDSLTGR